jgi:acyl carrier protein
MTSIQESTRLLDIVAEVLGVDPATVTDDDGPATLPDWTSLRHLQLVVTLEEIYQVSFVYEEVRGVPSIGRLRTVLRSKGVPT